MCSNEADTLVSDLRARLESEAALLVRRARDLARVEALVPVSAREEGLRASDLLANPNALARRALLDELARNGFTRTGAHASFLADEVACLADEGDLATWVVSIRQIVTEARKEGISTVFVRGFAASSLVLRACGFTDHDPLAAGLVPHDASAQAVHFDVPFTGSERVFDLLAEINLQAAPFSFVAFRSPVLDVLRDFARVTGRDPFGPMPDDALLAPLARGECRHVFGLDDSGDTLVNRLHPDLGEAARHPDAVGSDLRRAEVSTREDLFRFLALRRTVSLPDFHRWLGTRERSGSHTPWFEETCALSHAFPGGGRDPLFFREDLLTAMKTAIGWDWKRVGALRRALRRGEVDPYEKDAFIDATDAASFNLLEQVEPIVFHKAHLAALWRLLSATLHASITDAEAWRAAAMGWEQKHGLRWNDLGVVWGPTRLLASF